MTRVKISRIRVSDPVEPPCLRAAQSIIPSHSVSPLISSRSTVHTAHAAACCAKVNAAGVESVPSGVKTDFQPHLLQHDLRGLEKTPSFTRLKSKILLEF